MSKAQIKDNLFRLNLEQASRAVVLCFAADVPVALWGSPGIGKSAVVQQIADRLGYGLYDVRLSYHEPSDLGGIPYPREITDDSGNVIDQVATYLRPQNMPFRSEEKCILFLDEFDRANLATQNAALQLLLDRQLNGHHLSPKCRIAIAGNSSTDIGTTALSDAAANRICHLYVEAHSYSAMKSWQEWATENGVSEAMREFVTFKPSEGMRDEKPMEEMAYRTRRSEVMADKIYRLSRDVRFKCDDILPALIAGCMGRAACSEFMAFARSRESWPGVEAVIAQPDKADVPKDVDILATVTDTLCSAAESSYHESAPPENWMPIAKAIMEYGKRWPEEPRALLMKRLSVAIPFVTTTDLYQRWEKHRSVSKNIYTKQS